MSQRQEGEQTQTMLHLTTGCFFVLFNVLYFVQIAGEPRFKDNY